MAGISKTVLTAKPGKLQEVVDTIKSMTSRAQEVNGMQGFGLAITGDNEVTVFGVYDKVQDSEAAAPIVAEVFGDMGPLMDSVPDRGIFEGFWFSKQILLIIYILYEHTVLIRFLGSKNGDWICWRTCSTVYNQR